MTRTIKGFVLGFFLGGALFFIPAIASMAQVEKQIGKFVGSFKCRVVEMQEMDLWEGKLLVKSKKLNLSFLITAKDPGTYEVCPVGAGVSRLKDVPKK